MNYNVKQNYKEINIMLQTLRILSVASIICMRKTLYWKQGQKAAWY